MDITVSKKDLVGEPNPATPNEHWDVVLAGDVCYERPAADRITAWLRPQTPGAAWCCWAIPGAPTCRAGAWSG